MVKDYLAIAKKLKNVAEIHENNFRSEEAINSYKSAYDVFEKIDNQLHSANYCLARIAYLTAGPRPQVV